MDWDLWGPPPGPVEQETSCYAQCESHRNFTCDCGYDPVREDAVDEQCCIQVLKILVSKADAKISELEQELLSLQCELAWTEDDEWFDMSVVALKERIDFFQATLSRLRIKDLHDVEPQARLLLHTQPAESLVEFLRPLLINYSPQKDEEVDFAKDDMINSTSNALILSTKSLVQNTIGDYVNSNVITGHKIKESGTLIVAAECNAVLDLLPELQGNKTINTAPAKPAETTGEASWAGVLKSADACATKNNLCSNLGPGNAGISNVSEQTSTQDKRMALISFGMSSDNRRSNKDMIEPQLVRIGPSPSSRDASKHSIGGDSNEQEVQNLNPTTAQEEVAEHSCVSGSVLAGEGLPSKCIAEKTDRAERIKFSCSKQTASNHVEEKANEYAIGHPRDRGNFFESDLEVTREVVEFSTNATRKRTVPSPALEANGEGNHLRLNQVVIEEDKRCGTGMEGAIVGFDPRLGTSKETKSSDPYVEEKLSDYAPKLLQKQSQKEQKMAVSGNFATLSTSLEAKLNKRPLKNVKGGDCGPAEAENHRQIVLGIENSEAKAKKQPEETEPKLNEVTKAERDLNNKARTTLKSSLIFHPESQQSPEAPIFTDFSAVEVSSSSCLISKDQKRQRSGTTTPGIRLIESSGRIKNKLVHEDMAHDAAPEGSSDSIFDLKKKRKNTTSYTTNMPTKDSEMQIVLYHRPVKTNTAARVGDHSLMGYNSDFDSHSKAFITIPNDAANDLEKLSLKKLHAIAKDYKVTGYSKLPKKLLVEMLTNKISNVENLSSGKLSVLQSSPDCDSTFQSLVPMSTDVVGLRKLSVWELKCFAKQYKLPGYTKLRKEELVKRLADRVSKFDENFSSSSV